MNRLRRVPAALPVVLLALGLAAGAVRAQAPPAGPGPVELSVDPAMVKGPAQAPVTIVEFSDYQ